MTEPGTTPFRRRYRLGGLRLGLLAGLALGGAAPAVATDAALDAMPSAVAATSLPAAIATPVADGNPAGLPAEPHQRRMLLLLLMNSAGPLGPYGALRR